MAASTTRLSARRFLGWPAATIVCALAVCSLPGAGAALVYDRAAILDGEVWRLVTGHWVHFSARHLFCDVTVLAITGWLIGCRGDRAFPAVCLLASVSISLALLVFMPDMAYYGGVSGIAMASTVYLALQALHEPAPWRGAAVSVLLVCVAKVVLEAVTGDFTLAGLGRARVVPVPLSHLVGAASGVAVYLGCRIGQTGRCAYPDKSAGGARAIH
jgi:rhomboid family GlyGly-CTERM serine protease